MKRFFAFLLAIITLSGSLVYADEPDSAPEAVSGEKIVIVIDPGHGGIDGGTDSGTRTEKEYDLDIANYLLAELQSDSRFEVYMTRYDDSRVMNLPRGLVALEHNADVIISIHCDSLPQSTWVGGTSAYVSLIPQFDASVLAGKLLDAISEAVPIYRGKVKYREDTGDSLGIYYWSDEHQWDMPSKTPLGKKSDYYSLNTWPSKFGVMSVIIEHGYLSNAGDLKVLNDTENLKKIAQAEAEALREYYFGHEHVLGERSVDFPSSCTLTGTSSERCTVCGAKFNTEQLETDPDNHFWRTTAYKAPTCTEAGYGTYICQVSYNLNDRGMDCTVHELSETIAATGHDYEVLPNTAGDGKTYKRCRTCGLETVEDPCNGNCKYVVLEEVLPTCTEDGKLIKKCSACEGVVEEVLHSTGHSFIENTTPPTCTEPGRLVRTCEDCGYSEDAEIPATDHSFDEGTSNEDGTAYTCKNCGETKFEAAPTCTEDPIDKTAIVKTVAIVSSTLFIAVCIALMVLITRSQKKRKTPSKKTKKIEEEAK